MSIQRERHAPQQPSNSKGRTYSSCMAHSYPPHQSLPSPFSSTNFLPPWKLGVPLAQFQRVVKPLPFFPWHFSKKTMLFSLLGSQPRDFTFLSRKEKKKQKSICLS